MKQTLVSVVLLSIALLACGKNEDVSSTTAPVNSSDDALDSAASQQQQVQASGTKQGANASEPLAVARIKIGSNLDTQKRVMKENTTFAPKDAVYVVVETKGTGMAMLKANWLYLSNGKQTQLEQTSQQINASGTAYTEFHIVQNDGWKKGSYQVELLMEDQPVGIKEFRVE